MEARLLELGRASTRGIKIEASSAMPEDRNSRPSSVTSVSQTRRAAGWLNDSSTISGDGRLRRSSARKLGLARIASIFARSSGTSASRCSSSPSGARLLRQLQLPLVDLPPGQAAAPASNGRSSASRKHASARRSAFGRCCAAGRFRPCAPPPVPRHVDPGRRHAEGGELAQDAVEVRSCRSGQQHLQHAVAPAPSPSARHSPARPTKA